MSYNVYEISPHYAIEYLKKNHPKHSCCSNLFVCYGLFKEEEGGLFGTQDKLIGVVAYRKPWNKGVGKRIFEKEYANGVLEIHRLYVETNDPTDVVVLLGQSTNQLREKYVNIYAIVDYAKEYDRMFMYTFTGFYVCEDHGRSIRYIKFLNRTDEEKQALLSKCKVESILNYENYLKESHKETDIDSFLIKLGHIWHKNNKLRFGQLLINVFDKQDLYNKKDEDFLSELIDFYE